MQKTNRAVDLFTQLNSCAQVMKGNASVRLACRALVHTDFTFGMEESGRDKALWYFPRSIIGTTFINESYDKTQCCLEAVFGRGDPRVKFAIDVYCKLFIENHEDLSIDRKKELQEYCVSQTSKDLGVNDEYICARITPLLRETFPVFKSIHECKLIQFNENESVFLEDFLGGRFVSYRNWGDFLRKMVDDCFGNIDIFMAVVKKIIKHLNEPRLEDEYFI